MTDVPILWVAISLEGRNSAAVERIQAIPKFVQQKDRQYFICKQ